MSQVIVPPALTDICRVTSVKVLGITFTNHLSVSEHLGDVIRKCAQSLYAVKILRSYSMNDEVIRLVYKQVVLSKVMPGGGLHLLLTSNA